MTKGVKSASGTLVVRLYVAGSSPTSILARRNLKAALAAFPAKRVVLEIVDVVRDPERGFRDGILITPMLVRESPPPMLRMIGDLKDRDALLVSLGLTVPTARAVAEPRTPKRRAKAGEST